MRVHQRDIIEVNYLFPDGTTKPHMAIVVSNDELQEAEGFFYLSMISSKNYNPQYTILYMMRHCQNLYLSRVMSSVNLLVAIQNEMLLKYAAV